MISKLILGRLNQGAKHRYCFISRNLARFYILPSYNIQMANEKLIRDFTERVNGVVIPDYRGTLFNTVSASPR